MIRHSSRALAATLALAILAAPVAAQQMTSDGFAFLEAVKKRDGDKATALLANPSTTIVNSRERSSGDGALHMVARGRDFTWLNFLIGKGARVDMQSNAGDTPLAIAAQMGWVEGAQLLLRRRAAVDLANGRGETPLILAVLKGDMAMTRVLLAAGANPKRADSVAGYSALDYAKRNPRAAPLVRLLEAPPVTTRPAAGPSR